MAANRKLRFFRMVDGRRVSRIMELDSNLTFVDEYDATTQPTNAAVHIPRAQTANVGIYETPERKKALLMARWATRSITENPIHGTDEMRTAFFDEMDGLTAKYEAEYKQCPPCVIGALIRKYREQLETSKLLEEDAGLAMGPPQDPPA
jgi:hypothetical protein